MQSADLLRCIRCISKAYDGVLKRICSERGLSLLEVKVISFLHNNPEMNTAGDIAEYRLLSKGNVSRAVDSLIRQGYLRRVPDTAGRRRVYLYLLPSSAPVTDRIDREWSAFDAKLFCGFGEEEKQQYDRFKELLMQNAETIMEEALAEGDGK